MNSDHYIHNIDPVAFTIGDFGLSWYWLFYPLSFLSVFFISDFVRKRTNDLTKNQLIDFFVVSWIGLLLGSRLVYILFYNLEYYLENPEMMIQFWRGGMSFHGALLGGFAASYLFAKIRKVDVWSFYDNIVFGLPVALFLGRIGNFINGELWGRQSELPWAVVFPQADQIPRHPSEIYEAILEGPLLAALLILAYKKFKLSLGQLSALFVLGYGALRFIVEFFREPDRQVGYIFNYFSMGQLLCLSMIILGAMIWRARKAS